MLLGRPVIATAHPARRLPDPGHRLSVAYRLVPVAPGDYPFGEGLLWAEPCLESLAENMRLAADQPALARRRARAGRDLIAARHDPRIVGTAYLSRLQGACRPHVGTGNNRAYPYKLIDNVALHSP